VCPDYVVVYGTGWRYRPYIGTFWIGWPCTYGFGASFACGPHVGFGFGFAAGFAVGTWCHPWWGPFAWGWRHGFNFVHVSINHFNIYHGWSRTIVRETHSYGFNAWRGREWTHHWASHFNPYSSRVPVREARGRYHAYEGNLHARPEISRVYQSPRAMMPPRAIPPRENFAARPPPIERRNNLYGDRAGNVYRFNPSVNGWERNYGAQWRSVPAPRVQELNRHEYGRSLGQQRFDVQRSHGRDFERRRDHEH